jgi:hypothetical protein
VSNRSSLWKSALLRFYSILPLFFRYMKKVLDEFRSSYSQYAPLLQIVSFIRLYSEVFNLKSTYEHKIKMAAVNDQDLETKTLVERMRNELNGNDVEDRINVSADFWSFPV